MPSSDDAVIDPGPQAETAGPVPERIDRALVADSGTAAEVLHAWWLSEVGDLVGFEARTRSGEVDALHQARVRVRALRSVASVYRTAFDRRARRGLDGPLAAYGAVLGAARDAEVRELALGELRDDVRQDDPRHDDLVAALDALCSDARSEADSATRRVLTRLDSADHASLMLRLAALVVDAPVGSAATDPMEVVARDALGRAAKRVTDRAVIALRPTATLEQLHALRKASRRLRYAAEAAGSWAEQLSRAAEAVQNALGDHRDGVLLAGELRARADKEKSAAASALEDLAEETDTAARNSLSGCAELMAALTAAIADVR
ncbi:CHAD domain-containing protein [Planctomonas sp. JC2975]|uniref:CHAD domain-containing protein n=1 Tax=Planctomonas sp. JC2975 TaxID=2729626 RepID=UPI0014730807|nr:CHAD domain-containing protein [Planctomonas sp. JC2975]NNC12990.1 CHAD domain-containing protein [Planctomonas sp. JC2975]